MVIEMGFFENRKKNKLIKFVNSSDCSESVKKEAISKINDGTFTAQYQVSKFIEKSKKKAPKIIKNEEPPRGVKTRIQRAKIPFFKGIDC